MNPVAFMRRDPRTAAEVQRILRLPDDRWAEIEVSFATDEIATCKVTMMLDRGQLIQLANLLVEAGEPTPPATGPRSPGQQAGAARGAARTATPPRVSASGDLSVEGTE